MVFPSSQANSLRDTGDSVADARRSVRYILEAIAKFAWVDTAGTPRERQGVTRDVSQKGAYVVAADCPPRGAAVKIRFSLPPVSGEKRPLRIEAEGIVLRVERLGNGASGFAVTHRRVNLPSS